MSLPRLLLAHLFRGSLGLAPAEGVLVAAAPPAGTAGSVTGLLPPLVLLLCEDWRCTRHGFGFGLAERCLQRSNGWTTNRSAAVAR